VADEALLLGIDGGNTKAVALVARVDGTVVGTARRLACADPYAVGTAEAIAVVTATAEEALLAARVAGTDGWITQAAASMAGADWPEDLAELSAALRPSWPSIRVVNDALGALRAAVPDGPGVVVVAGTGAATGSRGPDGSTWHSSFWQEPQGARELAVRTMQALVRVDLGIEPATSLTARVLAATGDPTVEALLHRRTRRGPSRWAAFDGLAGVLLDAAADGDPTAEAIVREQGVSLGRTALAAARRVGIPEGPFPLALTGGLFRHEGTHLAEALIETVHAQRPDAEPVRPGLPPVAGALLLAFDDAGIAVTAEVEARLSATLPTEALYDTRAAAPIGGD
jgi:N-acetylglucosamine kinase-like BadF-type ATPase